MAVSAVGGNAREGLDHASGAPSAVAVCTCTAEGIGCPLARNPYDGAAPGAGNLIA